MMRVGVVLAIVGLVALLPAQALAFDPRAGDTVIIGEAVSDDVYAIGRRVEVGAAIDGDLVAAARTVMLNAPVTGAVLAAGATVNVNDRVDRSVRAAGATVRIRGSVGTDAIVFAGRFTLADAARVGRDLVAAAGQVRIAGSVGRDAMISGGSVTLGGTITGNVRVDADTLVVLPSARIAGKLTYSASQDADIQPGAQISGGIERTARAAATPRRMARPAAGFGLWSALVEFAWLLVLGVVALALSTRGVLTVADRIRRRFWGSLLTGFVLAVVVPVAIVVAFITVVGIPVGGVALLLYLATLYPAKVFTAAWIGDWVMDRLQPGKANGSPYVEMLIGVLIVAVLISLPFVGWVFRTVAVLVGFGALWAQIWAARRGSSEPLG
jgi:cytoskeletal protein CcmA (bactofilin family)